MNCRDNESLILAERDGALTQTQLAALSDHVATCPACAKLRADLAAAMNTYQAGLRVVVAPDADEAWRELQNRLSEPAKRGKKRPLAPVIWFGASLAAAAAFAFAFLVTQPAARNLTEHAAVTPPPSPLHDPSFIAGADYVEAGDPDASVMVFVDRESGWLVVWATDSNTATSG
jgi:anti-sigma factor RsiW